MSDTAVFSKAAMLAGIESDLQIASDAIGRVTRALVEHDGEIGSGVEAQKMNLANAGLTIAASRAWAAVVKAGCEQIPNPEKTDET